MVAPLAIAGLKAGADVGTKAATAAINGHYALRQAEVQAKADFKIARVAADATKTTTSITEADEILSVMDRPVIRGVIRNENGDSCEYSISLLTIWGAMALHDMYRDNTQRGQNIELFQSLIGIPVVLADSAYNQVAAEPAPAASTNVQVNQGESGGGSNADKTKTIFRMIFDQFRRAQKTTPLF